MMVDFWDPYGEPPEPPDHFDFMEDCEIEDDGLPPVENLQTACGHGVPEQSPAMIEGVLRKGHKMLLAGPSKAGKSFALIELAVCIASGTPWMNRFECRRGKVLYVNLEVDPVSAKHRFHDVSKALELPEEAVQAMLPNIDLWNLRGYCINWPHFVDICCSRARREQYDVIIIDPFYKLNAGRENNVFDMVQFCNGLDRISAVNGAAVIYCHHHSKGDQGWKNSMDRASGSGVFARDVDALLDIIELELPPERQRAGVTAWRIEGTLREFPSFEPVDVWFNYPMLKLEKRITLHTFDVEYIDQREPKPRAVHHELCVLDGGRVSALERLGQSPASWICQQYARQGFTVGAVHKGERLTANVDTATLWGMAVQQAGTQHKSAAPDPVDRNCAPAGKFVNPLPNLPPVPDFAEAVTKSKADAARLHEIAAELAAKSAQLERSAKA